MVALLLVVEVVMILEDGVADLTTAAVLVGVAALGLVATAGFGLAAGVAFVVTAAAAVFREADLNVDFAVFVAL